MQLARIQLAVADLTAIMLHPQHINDGVGAVDDEQAAGGCVCVVPGQHATARAFHHADDRRSAKGTRVRAVNR